MVTLTTGDYAPDFNLISTDEVFRKLSYYKGSVILLYFYPYDDTPGCIKEAKSFRDKYKDFVNMDIVLFGISPDDVFSHQAFSKKYAIPYPLLSDTDFKVSSEYGVLNTNKDGTKYILRTTFLIGKDGKIIKVWVDVKPNNHASKVIEEVIKLRA
jgi:peroxiredoxin Q/BCP